jgi:hypothetical protein
LVSRLLRRNIHFFGGFSPSFATSETVTIDNVNKKRFGIGTTSPFEKKLDVENMMLRLQQEVLPMEM